MSCYILEKKDMDQVLTVVVKLLNYPYNELSDATKEAFADCIENGKYDPHKVYRKLYINNLMAYNERYSENARKFPEYTGLGKIRDYDEAFKELQLYEYQITEVPVCDTPFYQAVIDIRHLYGCVLYDAYIRNSCRVLLDIF